MPKERKAIANLNDLRAADVNNFCHTLVMAKEHNEKSEQRCDSFWTPMKWRDTIVVIKAHNLSMRPYKGLE